MAQVTDATVLRPGCIVRVADPLSSSGKPIYPHFFVVLAIPDQIKAGAVIPLIGISSRIDPQSADPARHVAMKWQNRPKGDPETGLKVPCHACVDFTHVLRVRKGEQFALEVEAEFEGKFIRAEKLQTLAGLVNAWARRK